MGGLSCDAHHITEPRSDGSGVKICVSQALEQAKLKADDIDYINAHATSTPAGDMAEINAMHQIFKNPENHVINATKSMIGHGLGAAGGLEAVVAVQSIIHDEVHPTINLDNPEDNILFETPREAKKMNVDVVLSNSFGFGGHNASILLGKLR